MSSHVLLQNKPNSQDVSLMCRGACKVREENISRFQTSNAVLLLAQCFVLQAILRRPAWGKGTGLIMISIKNIDVRQTTLTIDSSWIDTCNNNFFWFMIYNRSYTHNAVFKEDSFWNRRNSNWEIAFWYT